MGEVKEDERWAGLKRTGKNWKCREHYIPCVFKGLASRCSTSRREPARLKSKSKVSSFGRLMMGGEQ